jgi:hypothetical protein
MNKRLILGLIDAFIPFQYWMLIKNVNLCCLFSLSKEQIYELGFNNLLLALSSRNMMVCKPLILKSGTAKEIKRSSITSSYSKSSLPSAIVS